MNLYPACLKELMGYFTQINFRIDINEPHEILWTHILFVLQAFGGLQISYRYPV